MQIDLDLARIGLRYPVDVGLVGQSWDVLRALLPLIHPKRNRSFLTRSQERMKKWNRTHDGTGDEDGHAAQAASRDLSGQ